MSSGKWLISVTQVIEQNLTGIDHLRYFSSSSASSGQLEIILTFEPKADPDIAQVQVQNKVQAIKSLLPQKVQSVSVTVYFSLSLRTGPANEKGLQIPSFQIPDGSV